MTTRWLPWAVLLLSFAVGCDDETVDPPSDTGPSLDMPMLDMPVLDMRIVDAGPDASDDTCDGPEDCASAY